MTPVTITGSPTAPPPDQAFSFARGEDVAVPLQLQPSADVTGWTFSFAIRRDDEDSAGPELVLSGAPGLVVTNAATGLLLLTLTRVQTLALAIGRHSWDWWRTDGGHATRLAAGTFNVLAQDLY